MPAVAQAAVVAREDDRQRAASGCVCGGDGRRGGARCWRRLRAHLAESLPEYMVPSAFVVLERLPLTPNGKLDRRALPAPEAPVAAMRRLPRTPQEEVLCCLFAEMLGLAAVGIDDNFFELGGDSIMSIQLVSRARKAGLLITPRAVFQHQTVATLAAMRACRAGGDGLRRPRRRGRVRCRRRRSCAGLAERGGPIERFSQAMLLTVPAALREDHLAAALQSLLDHHDALRLRLDVAAQRRYGSALPRIPLCILSCVLEAHGRIARHGSAAACLRRVRHRAGSTRRRARP